MLSEGRKRDAAANALLGIAFAANAAQSPKDLIRSGNIEGPGVQLMDRMMRKRKEANRNLDSARVSHPARNKTFKEFVEEVSLLETQTTQRIVQRSAELIKSGKNPEIYKNLLRKALNRLNPKDNVDYPGREAARKDKYLIPSGRTSSFPELAGVSTRTKNPKKLRKQRALGELT